MANENKYLYHKAEELGLEVFYKRGFREGHWYARLKEKDYSKMPHGGWVLFADTAIQGLEVIEKLAEDLR